MAVKNRIPTDIANDLDEEAMRLIRYFAQDTTEKIFEHIDRMDIRDTGNLRNSIKSTVMANAGGHSALVSFYYAYYAPYVEMALGKYWGVDADLGKGVGVRKTNIDIPPIPHVGYGKLTASFSGLPGGHHGKLREQTHRPRPFIRSEIMRQIDRISYRLLEHCTNTCEIRLLETLDECLMPNVPGNYWEKEGFKLDTAFVRNNFAGGRKGSAIAAPFSVM